MSSLSLFCLVSLSLVAMSWTFGTPIIMRLLHYLDSYRGVDQVGVFSLFLKMAADIIAPKLSIIVRELIRLGSLSSGGSPLMKLPFP